MAAALIAMISHHRERLVDLVRLDFLEAVVRVPRHDLPEATLLEDTLTLREIRDERDLVAMIERLTVTVEALNIDFLEVNFMTDAWKFRKTLSFLNLPFTSPELVLSQLLLARIF